MPCPCVLGARGPMGERVLRHSPPQGFGGLDSGGLPGGLQAGEGADDQVDGGGSCDEERFQDGGPALGDGDDEDGEDSDGGSDDADDLVGPVV